jgi:glycosyltransferase involved in cell wall biosynthesis
MTTLFWLAVVSLLLTSAIAIEIWQGNRTIKFLRDISPQLPTPALRVSLIVAARDEERNIEVALKSLLVQDYPDYEVIMVDDRSSDTTPAILQRIALGSSRLRVVRIDELPAGWLGKNHALHRGAQQASGALLIFADADIVMHRDAIRRAVSHMLAHRRDHIAVAPELISTSTALGMFVGAFTILFSLYSRPWKAPNPKSRCFIGIGAFNMVRAQVYRAIEGHERIAMRPDDDIKLGKIIKDAGYSQEMLFGLGMISVEWYASLAQAIYGLEKNSLAGVNYSVAAIIGATLMQLVLFVWPFAALLLTSGWTLTLNAAICVLWLGLYVHQSAQVGIPRWYAIGLPFAIMLFAWILWRSTFITLRNDGIDWRGTHYSLSELKGNRV